MAIKPWTLKAAGSLPLGRDMARDGDVLFLRPACKCAFPVPVGMFIFLAQRRRARIMPMAPAAALLDLARRRSSFQHEHRMEDAFAGFIRALRSAQRVRLESPCPAAAVDLLLEAAGRGAGTVPSSP